MRNDVFISDVLDKCETLKDVGFWFPLSNIRPKAWLENFEQEDKYLAALLLEKFTYYNNQLTNSLLISSYHSIGDGLPKGPSAPPRDHLISSLNTAVFTPVTGEDPNPTDSGNLFCRKARQILNINEDKIVTPEQAVKHAASGGTVVFIDDFIGSGDQFLYTWSRIYGRSSPKSFKTVHSTVNFTAMYISLVATDFGLDNIYQKAPSVAVSTTHTLTSRSTFQGLEIADEKKRSLESFIAKYSSRLKPKEEYIANNPRWLKYGYKERGLMFGFEHSIPDATLPIFWAPGDNWEPLIERR